jgi:hypothetical protein
MKRLLVSFFGRVVLLSGEYKHGFVDVKGKSWRTGNAAGGFTRITAACVTLLVVLSLGTAIAPRAEAAANANNFDAGYIISDSRFYDSNAMTASQIQTFLNQQVPTCHPEWDSSPSSVVCLKDYKTTTTSKANDSYCAGYTGGQNQSAAQVIDGVARSCGVSQQILLVLLQKENGLVTHSWPSPWRYKTAMGYGCPDTAACDSQYYGFFNQVYNAARQYKLYQAKTSSYQYRIGSNNIYWNPNSACGYSTVTIRNQATAGLYNYTPYRPNQAALNAGYGDGDSCSSYGNRNFYLYYSDWFGDPKTEAPGSGPQVSNNARVTLPNNKYFINSVAKDSSSIDIAGGRTDIGTRIQLFQHNKSQAQQFQLTAQMDGSYEITNINSNMVLDVEDGIAHNGATVRQWTPNGSAAQRWFIRDSGAGFYIQSALGNWVLDLTSGSTSDRTAISLYAPNDSAAQKFFFASASDAVESNTLTKISSTLNSQLVLDVSGASLVDGAKIQLYPWNLSEAQLFRLEEVGNNVYVIRNKHSNKVLDVSGASTSDGSLIQQYTSNGSAAQHWAILDDGAESYSLVNTLSGKVIDIPGGIAAESSGLQLYACNSSKAQQFTLSSYRTPRQILDTQAERHRNVVSDGVYSIGLSSVQSMVLDVRGGSLTNSAIVQIYGANGSGAQQWRVSHDPQGYVILTNTASGMVLDIRNASPNIGTSVQQYPYNNSWAQKWIVERADDGSQVIYSALTEDRALDVTGGNINSNVPVQEYVPNGTVAQKFQMIRLR